MKTVNLFNERLVGRYNLPTDFVSIDDSFLENLIDKDFKLRIKITYEYLTNRKFLKEFEEIFEGEFDVVSVIDDVLGFMDLSVLENAEFNDFIFDKQDLFGRICSFISVLTATYVELLACEIIVLGEEINLAISGINGFFVLASYIAKRIGLPLNVIICGIEKSVDFTIKSLFLQNFIKNEIEDCIYDFYDEYGYALDENEAVSYIALNEFYNAYDEVNFTLILKENSPYYNARKILKTITGKAVLDNKKAINELFLETAEEIPSVIQNGKYYLKNGFTFDIHEAFEIIKDINKD